MSSLRKHTQNFKRPPFYKTYLYRDTIAFVLTDVGKGMKYLQNV